MNARAVRTPGPDHPITIRPAERRVRVIWRGAIVADSARAIELREGSYKSVFYIPRGDVDMAHFARSEKSTYCPYKGDASYFSLVGVDARDDDAVWTYEQPFPAVANIKDHVAFYPDRVQIETT